MGRDMDMCLALRWGSVTRIFLEILDEAIPQKRADGVIHPCAVTTHSFFLTLLPFVSHPNTK
jgi:hypothetical protein